MSIFVRIKSAVCELTHGGGMVKRDPLGRINWQCSTCGRWSGHPVNHDVERYVVDREIAERQAAMAGRNCCCGEPAVCNLDGDDLCQDHADEWVRAEGAASQTIQ